MQVLLVDDNKSGRMLFGMYLKLPGVEVDVASDGLEACAQAGRKEYDLILMDLMMPVMDGRQAVQRIREAEEQRGSHVAKIYALTAADEPELYKTLPEQGFDGLLTKPVRRAGLLDVLYEVDDKTGGGLRKLMDQPHPDAGRGSLQVDSAPKNSKSIPVLREDANTGVVVVHEQFREVVSTFLDAAHSSVSQTNTALEQCDGERIVAIGHRLKGAALSYGFETLGQLALQLEQAGARQDFGCGYQVMEELEKRLAGMKVEYEAS